MWGKRRRQDAYTIVDLRQEVDDLHDLVAEKEKQRAGEQQAARLALDEVEVLTRQRDAAMRVAGYHAEALKAGGALFVPVAPDEWHRFYTTSHYVDVRKREGQVVVRSRDAAIISVIDSQTVALS